VGCWPRGNPSTTWACSSTHSSSSTGSNAIFIERSSIYESIHQPSAKKVIPWQFFSLGSFSKITEMAKIVELLFSTVMSVYILTLRKNGLG
jgi:hypothetical protein